MVQKYQVKPSEVLAVQFLGSNKDECVEFTDKKAHAFSNVGISKKISKNNDNYFLVMPIFTVTGHIVGNVKVESGDYIIKNDNGTFNACKPDEFSQMYELINEAK